MNSYSSYPLNFPTDILFSFLVSFAFCVLVFFVFFLLFLKKIKIYILIYASDKKKFTRSISENKITFFWPKDFNLPMPKPIAKRTKYYLSLGFKFFDPIAYQNINF